MLNRQFCLNEPCLVWIHFPICAQQWLTVVKLDLQIYKKCMWDPYRFIIGAWRIAGINHKHQFEKRKYDLTFICPKYCSHVKRNPKSNELTTNVSIKSSV